MPSTLRQLLCATLLTGLAAAGLAQAPMPRAAGMYGGYVGLGAGASRYDLRSGSGGFDFDDGGSAIKLYAGAFFHPNLGLELGYLDLGKARRIGGNSSARGLNFSLVGRLPLGTQLDLQGKLGTFYGRTDTRGVGGYGVQLGKGSGFGLSYGAGLRWAFTPQWSAVLQWERQRLHFADRLSDVDAATLGLRTTTDTPQRTGRSGAAKDEIHRADQAQTSPEIVPFERLVQIEHRERDEHGQRDDLLHDLELAHAELCMADAVGRHLQQVFEQRDAPTHQGRHVPRRRGQILQVPIPGKGHEDIACHQQQDGLQRDGQGLQDMHGAVKITRKIAP